MPTTIAFDAASEIIGTDVDGVPVVYANEYLEPPENNDVFVRVGVESATGEAGEVGPNPFWFEDGEIEVLIFTRIGSGTREARLVSEKLLERFRLATTPPALQWLGHTLTEGGADEEGNSYFVMVLTIRYRVQTIVTA